MNGIILIDKEQGMTSRDVVDKLSHIFNTKAIGHTGTLDPMATGVLVLCVGKATKIAELITSYDKEYIAEGTLGIATDTLDTSGTVIDSTDNIVVTKERVTDALNAFKGKVEQVVPIYSAIKVNGRRLYKYARNNDTVELPKREIEIYDIALIDEIYKSENTVKFKVKCTVSKGTYIRSLIRDIGIKLGYPACMSSLRRTRQGIFKIEDCYTLDDISNNKYKILDIRDALSYMDEIIVDEDIEKKIKNGAILDKMFSGEVSKIVNKSGELLAIYKTYDMDPTKMKPYKMLI